MLLQKKSEGEGGFQKQRVEMFSKEGA